MTRRRLTTAALLLLVIIGALGLKSWDIAVERVRTHVTGIIRERAGLEIETVEAAKIALLPLPSVKLQGVAFAGDRGRVAGRAAEVVARVRLTSLLLGRLGFGRIDLRSPTIELALAPAAGSPRDWVQGIVESLGRVSRDARIVITSGTLLLRRGETVATVVRDINLVLDEREATEPISLDGSVDWRGVATNIRATWPLGGERGKAALSLRSRLATVALDGERLSAEEATFAGKLRFETGSLPDALAWVGTAPPLAAAFGPVTLTADLRMTAEQAALSEARVTIDKEALDGALTVGLGTERWSLTGTLAGAALDLGRYYQRLADSAPGRKLAHETASDFGDWTSEDIDLRVSVDTATAGPVKLTELATQLLVKKERFEVAILRAGAYGGAVRGRLLAAPDPAGVDVRLQAGLERIAIAQAATAFPALARLSGTASAQLNLMGVGTDTGALRDALNGKVTASLGQGEVAGFAFADLMRRGERNPLTALRDWRQGKSAYETANLLALVQNGSVFVQEATMAAPGWTLQLAGAGSLATRRMELEGVLSGEGGTPRLPVTLRGPMHEPTMGIDGAALLREPAALTTPAR